MRNPLHRAVLYSVPKNPVLDAQSIAPEYASRIAVSVCRETDKCFTKFNEEMLQATAENMRSTSLFPFTAIPRVAEEERYGRIDLVGPYLINLCTNLDKCTQAKCHQSSTYNGLTTPKRLTAKVTVHTSAGPIRAAAYVRTCESCGAHYYYDHFYILNNGTKEYYAYAEQDKSYLLLIDGDTGGASFSAYSVELLEDYLRYAVHGNLTFAAFVTQYNEKHSSMTNLGIIDRNGFPDHVFVYILMRYIRALSLHKSIDLASLYNRSRRRAGMEELLLRILPRISASFSRYWGAHFQRNENPALLWLARDIEGTEYVECATAALDADPWNEAGKAKVKKWLDLLNLTTNGNKERLRSSSSSSSSRIHENDFEGCGSDLCSRVVITNGHQKCNRWTCLRSIAYHRSSQENVGLFLQCPSQPAYRNKKQLKYCYSCLINYRAKKVELSVVAEEGDGQLGEERTSDTKEGIREDLLALIGKQFYIPPDDIPSGKRVRTRNQAKAAKEEKRRRDEEKGEGQSIRYIVHDIYYATVYDCDNPSDGVRKLIADYYPATLKRKPASSQMDWSAIAEVSEWVRSTVAEDASRAANVTSVSSTDRPKQRGKKQSDQEETRFGVKCRLLHQLNVDITRDPDKPKSGTFLKGRCNSTSFMESTRDQKEGSDHVDRYGFVFSKILSSCSSPAGGTRYACLYETPSGMQRIYHSADEVSEVAKREFRWRIKQAEFKYSDAEVEERANSRCVNNDKELQDGRATTCGVLAIVTNCGIIVRVAELIGSESLTQVWLEWLDLYDDSPELKKRKVMHAYDDGCHAAKYAKKRKHLSHRASEFAETQMVCDYFHHPNHDNKGEDDHSIFCRNECDPDNHKYTRMCNTEAAEQLLVG